MPQDEPAGLPPGYPQEFLDSLPVTQRVSFLNRLGAYDADGAPKYYGFRDGKHLFTAAAEDGRRSLFVVSRGSDGKVSIDSCSGELADRKDWSSWKESSNDLVTRGWEFKSGVQSARTVIETNGSGESRVWDVQAAGASYRISMKDNVPVGIDTQVEGPGLSRESTAFSRPVLEDGHWVQHEASKKLGVSIGEGGAGGIFRDPDGRTTVELSAGPVDIAAGSAKRVLHVPDADDSRKLEFFHHESRAGEARRALQSEDLDPHQESRFQKIAAESEAKLDELKSHHDPDDAAQVERQPRVWFDPDDMDGYINVSRDGHTLERMSLEDAKRQGLVPPDADYGDLRQYRWADHRESYMSSVAGDADSIRDMATQMEEAVERFKQQVDELQPPADSINESAATVDAQLVDAQTASEAAKQLHADIVTAKDAAAEDAREAAEAAATAQQMAEQAAKSDEIQAEAKQAEAASETAKKEAKAAEQAAARAEDEASEARQAGDRADARAKEADLAANTAQHAVKEATKAAAQARTEAKEAQAAVTQVDASVKAALGHLAAVTKIKAQIAKLLETASDLQEQVEAKHGEGARLKGDIDDLMSKGRTEAQTRLKEADDASRKSDAERTTAEHVRDGAQNAARDADNHENKAEQSQRACVSHLQDARGAATRAQASLQDVIRCVEKARSMRG